MGGYLVTVTDTDTKNPVANAAVALHKDNSISIRLPNSRLLDYADQTTVTVQLVKDKSAVPDMSIAVTDKNDNYASGKTDKAGQITVPTGSGKTNEDGKVTTGYEDADGDRWTLTVKVIRTDTKRPISGSAGVHRQDRQYHGEAAGRHRSGRQASGDGHCDRPQEGSPAGQKCYGQG